MVFNKPGSDMWIKIYWWVHRSLYMLHFIPAIISVILPEKTTDPKPWGPLGLVEQGKKFKRTPYCFQICQLVSSLILTPIVYMILNIIYFSSQVQTPVDNFSHLIIAIQHWSKIHWLQQELFNWLSNELWISSLLNTDQIQGKTVS